MATIASRACPKHVRVKSLHLELGGMLPPYTAAKSTLTRVRVASKEQRVTVQAINHRLDEDVAGCADNGVTTDQGRAS
jgi:hypothetical protein